MGAKPRAKPVPLHPTPTIVVGMAVEVTPWCFVCGNDAKMPEDRPRFCSLKCALQHASDDTEPYRFCPKHGWWHPHEHGYCLENEGPDCVQCIDEGDRTLEKCVANNEHGTRLDRNNYCRYCGHYCGRDWPVPRKKQGNG